MLQLDTDQVLYFRSRRNHLAGGEAGGAEDCAERLLGAQAQVDSCAHYALSARTESRPTARDLAVLNQEGRLIRTWGQRDTLHLYSKNDWPLMVAASSLWNRSGRRGGHPPAELVKEGDAHFRREARPLTRSDLFELIPDSFLESVADHQGAQGSGGALRFAAGRLIWTLANQGAIVFGPKAGREVSYLHRTQVWPGDWPEHDPETASLEVTRRYLALFGPATPQDLAHYLGAGVTDARRWLERLADETVTCLHPEHGECLILERDVDEVRRDPVDEWPLRLLPGYDTMLMAHRNKRWILPDASQEPLVWRKSAVVAPVVLVRGRIAATWAHQKSGKTVNVSVEPLTSWRKEWSPHLRDEVRRLADHLKLSPGEITITK